MRLIIIMLIVPFAYGEYEYKASRMNYRWGKVASFPVTLHSIGYTKELDDFDLAIRYGSSDTKQNEVSPHYYLTNQIKQLFSLSGGYKKKHKEWSIHSGVNYTEYKEKTNLNVNSDTGFGYYLSIGYQVTSDIGLKLSYDHYYDKHKAGYGREVTSGTGIAITYR